MMSKVGPVIGQVQSFKHAETGHCPVYWTTAKILLEVDIAKIIACEAIDVMTNERYTSSTIR